jgi:hypothetical protein
LAKKSNSAASEDVALLDGLRKALAGPKPLGGKGDCLFPGKKLEKAAQEAVDRGYIMTRTKTIPAAGRKKAQDVVVAELTEKGRQFVLDTDSPKAILQALLPSVQSLAAEHTQQRQVDALHAELQKTTQECVKAIEKAFAKMEAAVAKALPAPVTGPSFDAQPLLNALQQTLARVTAPSSAGTNVAPPAPPTPPVRPPDQPKPPAESTSRITSEQLRQALRQAYDHLCLFVEFRDKLVEIPRLYHETVRHLPGVSVERFHRELDALSAEWKVELHKLNEVHAAKERELAIERDDRLYYYVFWK